MASKTIENDNDRRLTIMTSTFVPCGAKLPVIALMAGVIPFIIGDIAKMIVAIIVAPMIKNPLVKAGYIK